MKLSIGQLKDFCFDLLFPIRCLICGQRPPPEKNGGGPKGYLCPPCLEKVKFKNEPECAFCSSRSINGRTCLFCRQKYCLDFLWAVADYQEPTVKKMLWAFKYRFIADLKVPLSRLVSVYLRRKKLDKLLENYRQKILIIPVPLHRRRLNWRSYNQSELLSQELAAEFNLNMEQDVLTRTRHQKPQAEIKDKLERVKNIKNIFVCRKPEKIRGKIILLTDDVSTTGSTLDECAGVLKQSGAEKVIGLVVAKG